MELASQPHRRKRLTRDEKKAATRARLLDAAADIFGRQGYFVTSVEDVAEEAGFSKGAVYSNFENKDELFLALVEQRITDRVDRMVEVGEASGDDLGARAAGAGDAFVQLLDEEPEWMLLMLEFRVCAARNPQVHRQFVARYRALRESVARLIERRAEQLGVTLPQPAHDMATAAFVISSGLAIERLADPELVPENLLGNILMQVFGGGATRSDRADAVWRNSEDAGAT
jgi:AcrR family transcriptional regulator